MIFSFTAVMILPVVIIAITVLSKVFYLVHQAEVIVIERFGRYHRLLTPGVHIVIPFVDVPRRVQWSFLKSDGKRYYRFHKTLDRIDLREAVYDFPKQNVITKDNVTMEINALLYYQITDPKAAVYEIDNLPEAIEKLTQTKLRDVFGSMDLDETLVSRAAINQELCLTLDEATDKWGVKVNRVELQEVNPPLDIREAMEKQMRAERDRRASILAAEGKKRSAILESEGLRESEVLKAKGFAESQLISAQAKADARRTIIEAEAQALEMIGKSLPEGADPTAYLVALQYIKMVPKMAEGKNDKLVLMPYEASALTGSVASIKKLFDTVK